MLFLKHFFYAKAFSTFIINLQFLTLVRARVINECSADTSQTSEFINNPNTACNSLYPYIYCNSALSTYCTLEQCMEEYECERQGVIGAPVDGSPTPSPSPSASNPTTSTTTVSSTFSTTTTPAAALISDLSTTTTSLAPTSAPITTTAVNMRATCQAGVTGNYAYPRNCRYYYRCSNGYHWLQDCGFSMSFDVIDRYCKSTKVARCSTESRRESFW